MTDWTEEIERERRRAEQTNHPGRLRTIARRIAGLALRQLPGRLLRNAPADDYVGMLRGAMDVPEIPAEVRDAASRLQARLSADFTSPSKDPVGDAMIIVRYVEEVLRAGTSTL